MRMYVTSVFGAPLEVLQEKMEFTPNSMFFCGVSDLEFLELHKFGSEFMERS